MYAVYSAVYRYQSATNSELEIAANKNEYLAELVERYLHLTNGPYTAF